MGLRHLRYFVAVGEEENMSRAAVKLHVSQPALSKQVRDLKDEIGFSSPVDVTRRVRKSWCQNGSTLTRNVWTQYGYSWLDREPRS